LSQRWVSHISTGTIGFVRIGDDGRALLGSGTLVAAGQARTALTAATVLDRLPDHGRVGIVLRTDLNQISLDAAELTYRRIIVPGGTDLGLVVLSPNAARRFAETKRFVDLTASFQSDAGDRDSSWSVNGFSKELTMTQLPLDCFDMVVGYTNVTGLPDGDVDTPAGLEMEFQVRGVSETGAPLPLDGIEGGGLWRVAGSADARLSGVVISAPTGTSSKVHCIGPSALAALERL
jgi:hypothetical protein